MTTYHLFHDKRTNRMIIHTEVLRDCEVIKTTKASCWIEAKKKFKFELTPLQEEMLNAKNNSLDVSRRIIRDIKDAGKELRTADDIDTPIKELFK